MTTAHRPTWAPSKGHEEQGGNRIFVPSRAVSAKDLPAHTKLKFRVDGQGSKAEIEKRDLKLELEIAERKHFEERRKEDLELLENTDSLNARKLIPMAADADLEEENNDGSDGSEYDSEDEEAELMAELQRIKQEREEEAKRKKMKEAEKLKKEEEELMLHGNPLVNKKDVTSFDVKRRWDDDVVFKNQTRGEPKEERRFINDTVRSYFHQKFLQRYIK